MLSQEITIDTPNGFKVYPVTRFIKTARSLKSDITLTCRGKVANAKSPSKLMDLALVDGDLVTISVSGQDEEKNFVILVGLMNKLGQ